MKQQFKENEVITYSGKRVDILNPDPDTIDIVDIAHALSNQCRFGGHTRKHYSVAQHSIECMKRCKDERYKLQALMHDASEAYLVDIPTPVKRLLPEYLQIEDNMMRAIAQKFSFEWPMSAAVMQADRECLELEFESAVYDWKLYDGSFNFIEDLFLTLFYLLKAR